MLVKQVLVPTEPSRAPRPSLFVYSDRASSNLGWARTPSVAEDSLECLVLLPLPFECCGCKQVPPYLAWLVHNIY